MIRVTLSMPADGAARLQKLFAEDGPEAAELKAAGVQSISVTAGEWDGRLFEVGKMTVHCDRCKQPIAQRYGWNNNSMICEPCLVHRVDR